MKLSKKNTNTDKDAFDTVYEDTLHALYQQALDNSISYQIHKENMAEGLILDEVHKCKEVKKAIKNRINQLENIEDAKKSSKVVLPIEKQQTIDWIIDYIKDFKVSKFPHPFYHDDMTKLYNWLCFPKSGKRNVRDMLELESGTADCSFLTDFHWNQTNIISKPRLYSKSQTIKRFQYYKTHGKAHPEFTKKHKNRKRIPITEWDGIYNILLYKKPRFITFNIPVINLYAYRIIITDW